MAVVLAAPAATRIEQPDLSAYRGLGTWIDIYSPAFRADPARTVAALAAHRVRTLFVETGNYRQRADVVGTSTLSGLIDAAHARHIAVVGWYLPALTDAARDLRRAVAAATFTSTTGERFDSFALDIEASLVRSVPERTRRLLALSSRLRAAVGREYPLGAIIPSPVGMKLLPHYWPAFPYAQLARTYDVLLPMAYFSYRAHTPAAVARYVRTSVAIIRTETGNETVPIHVIGGLSGATDKTAATAFVTAVASCAVGGFSMYDFFSTRSSVWSVLQRAAAKAAG